MSTECLAYEKAQAKKTPATRAARKKTRTTLPRTGATTTDYAPFPACAKRTCEQMAPSGRDSSCSHGRVLLHLAPEGATSCLPVVPTSPEQRLTQQLGSSATDFDIAADLGIGPADVREARQAELVRQPLSLDEPLRGQPDLLSLADLLGTEDPQFEHLLGMQAVATGWASGARPANPRAPLLPGHDASPGSYERTASTVFFSAPGCDGLRGAFFRACSSLTPRS